MGTHVDLLEEIRNRIQTSIDSGTLKNKVKALFIGPRSQTRGGTNYPVINIWPEDGSRDPEFHNNGNRDNQSFRISLIANKLTSDTNTMYKTVDETNTGIEFLKELLLDVLDNNTSGAVDLEMNGASSDLGTITWVYEYHAERTEIVFSFTKATVFNIYGGVS